MLYVLVVAEGDVLDGPGLEPRAGVSKFVGDDSHAVQVRVVEVDLVVRIGPAVANSNSFEDYARLSEEGVVGDDLAAECWDVVPCEGLARDVERTLLEGRPRLVEVGEEVEQVVSGLLGRAHQRDGLVLHEGETHGQRLVDENRMPHDVPRLGQLVRAILSHPNRAELGKGAELRAGSGSALQPNNERDSLIGYCDAVRMRPEETVIHARLSLGIVPIDLLITCINKSLPE